MKTFPTGLPRTLEMIEQGIAAGWHIGAQVFVSLHGRVIVDQALGEARRGTLMTPSTMMLWFSSGKPITAVAIAQLWEQGMLALDDPVQRYPSYAGKGAGGGITGRVIPACTGIKRVPGEKLLPFSLHVRKKAAGYRA
jgi:CubicO group peptidase (beta-lactamase class C family)